jgi:hypothetical protein
MLPKRLCRWAQKLTLVVWTLLPLSIAGGLAAAETWHSSTVRWIYPQGDGGLVVAFQTDSPSCTSPATPDYYYVYVGQNGVTAEGFKNILAALLSAAAQGRAVQFAFDNATGACYVNRVLVFYE